MVNVIAGTTTFTNTVNSLGSINIGGPYGTPAILTLSGDTVSASTVTVGTLAGDTAAALNVGGPGTLTVGNGASVSAGTAAIGTNGTTGILNINPGGSFTVTGSSTAGSHFIGAPGSRTAPGTGGTGIVNVTGPTAELVSNNSSAVPVVGAADGVGTLNITSGGTASSAANLIIGNAAASPTTITGPQGTGTVLVSGMGSALNVATTMTVAQYGIGTLTVQKGEIVSAPGGIFVATQGVVANGLSAKGTINIGDPPGQLPLEPGTLNTPVVHLQNGIAEDIAELAPSSLNFNHQSTDYVFSPMITGGGPGFPNIGQVTSTPAQQSSPRATRPAATTTAGRRRSMAAVPTRNSARKA